MTKQKFEKELKREIKNLTSSKIIFYMYEYINYTEDNLTCEEVADMLVKAMQETVKSHLDDKTMYKSYTRS